MEILATTLTPRGNIEVVEFLGNKVLLSAGDDPYLRFWDFEQIDDLEPEEDGTAEIEPIKEIFLFPECRVISVNLEFFATQGFVTVKTQQGKILKIIFKDVELITMEKKLEKKDYAKVVRGKHFVL